MSRSWQLGFSSLPISGPSLANAALADSALRNGPSQPSQAISAEKLSEPRSSKKQASETCERSKKEQCSTAKGEFYSAEPRRAVLAEAASAAALFASFLGPSKRRGHALRSSNTYCRALKHHHYTPPAKKCVTDNQPHFLTLTRTSIST